MKFSRYLKYTIPLIKGDDVVLLQQQLLAKGYRSVGVPDGKFGAATQNALTAFQRQNGLTVDGIAGQQTWNKLFEESPSSQADTLAALIPQLTQLHGFRDSIQWRILPRGVETVKDIFERSGSKPKTVTRVWESFGPDIEKWALRYGVPVELIVATICTETGGKPESIRIEPGYISDEKTPDRVSPGLMQTLISTAQSTLMDSGINREWLLVPSNSIQAGTAYITSQLKNTNLDPPKVACAYNAGGVYHNSGPENRWKMRQFPMGTSHHADRFIQWMNDFCFVMENESLVPEMSFIFHMKKLFNT